MASLVDKVVKKTREHEKNFDGPPDRTLPQGTLLQKYSGHRNAR